MTRNWLYGLLLLGLALPFTAGCKDRDEASDGKTIAKDTRIHDRLLGGKEIEEKEVIQREDGQYETRENKTKLDEHGNVEERKSEINKPDSTNKSDSDDVNVEIGGRHGVKVDVDTNKDGND